MSLKDWALTHPFRREPGLADRRESIGRIRIFLRSFLLFTAVLLALLWALDVVDGRIQTEEGRIRALAATERGVNRGEAFVKSASGDIQIVAQNEAVVRFVGGDETEYGEVAALFETVLTAKPTVTQLRLLDLDGHETLRVNSVAGDAVTVPREELQDKSARYYFRNALSLQPNGIYLSALDLNVEHGAIQEPWLPVLRLAVPVVMPDGSTGGIVVMNLDAGSLIADVAKMRSEGSGSLQLLNKDGYWLEGVPKELLWGFVFQNEHTMARKDPGLWRRIVETGNGEFTQDGRLYVVRTMQPSLALAVARDNADIHHADEKWIVLAEVPVPPPLLGFDRWPRLVYVLLASAVLSLFFAGAVEARRRADEGRREAEAELVRVDRMASLGGLVAGIAHELNTPLGNALSVSTTVAERVKVLSADIEAGRIRRATLEALLSDIREGTDMLVRSLGRAAEIVGHFKQVAVDQTSDRRRSFRIDALIEDVASTLRPQFKGTSVVLKTETDSEAVLDSFPGPLAQVITNLVANARLHAFSEGDTGEVVISVCDLDDDMVELSVRDTGAGMPEAVLARMFDPFFTTRMGRGGTGLGLSIVFNIVTGTLGGSIRAESGLGQGTSVIAELPLSAPDASADVNWSQYNVDRRKNGK